MNAGVPLGNFEIKVGKGYFVYCEWESTFRFIGFYLHTITLELYPGWNGIGLPISTADLVDAAKDLGHGINEQNPKAEVEHEEVEPATRIQDWWAGMWRTYLICMPFGNFPIDAGKGYFVYCKERAIYSPNEFKITSLGKDHFTLSWITSREVQSQINYGVEGDLLDKVAFDDRGADTVDVNHIVTVGNLLSGTTYWYDIKSNGTVDDNCGKHYWITTLANGGDLPEYAPGEVIVGFVEGIVEVEQAEEALKPYGLEIKSIIHVVFDRLSVVVKVEVGEELHWASVLEEDDLIEYAEPNYIIIKAPPPQPQ
jgi:hypothetical protein